MNLEILKGNEGWRVQLAPQAIHLDKCAAAGGSVPVSNPMGFRPNGR
jgi:hypothetical protein